VPGRVLAEGAAKRAASSTARVSVFASKLAVPRLRTQVVRRDPLVERLRRSDVTQIVVVAPAGYGKSTLAALWAEADPRPFGWVAVDRFDNDPVVFLTYLGLALHSIAPLDGELLEALTASQCTWQETLGVIVEAIARMPRPFVLVIDDAHRLEGPSATEVVPSVAGCVLPGSALALVSRSPVPTIGTRELVEGHALRLSAEDLSMDDGEAAQLLASAGLDIDPAAAGMLLAKTEGWPGGLYLAALALRADPDPDAAAALFSGGDRLVTDFVAEEILVGIDAEEVDFLLATAVLPRLSGDLCDDVLDTSGSGAMLKRLAHDFEFVITLGHAGEWYRYHHLVGQMLRNEMHDRDRTRVHNVARRASAWFERHGEPELAVECALAAHDTDRASALVWMHSPAMLAVNRVATVGIWLERFDAATVERLPALVVSAAWHAMALGDAPEFHRLRDVLHRQGGAALPDGSPAAAVLGIMDALVGRDGLTAMRANAARASAELPSESPYRAVATFLEGSAAALLDDRDAARELLAFGIRLSSGRLPAVHLQCLTQLGRLELGDDNPVAAERLADEAVRVMADADIADRPVSCMCHAFAAVLHLRIGANAVADDERARGLALSDRAEDLATYPWLACRLDLACAAVMARDLTVARPILDDAQRHLARLPDRGTLDAYADRIEAMLAAAVAPAAHLVEPLTPAELRVLAYLPTHHTFGQIAEELFLSRNTVKSHAMAIYRKLDVASRNDAVTEARRLYLLEP